jgi:DNA-directed RNA polymerase specialized sigma24 family protein
MERVPRDEDDLRQIAQHGEDVGLLDRVQALPPEQRRAVTARVVDERPYEDIAAQHGVSETVARKRVSRGVAALRANIEKRS